MRKFLKKLGIFGIPVIVVFGLTLLWVLKPLFFSSYLSSCLGVRVTIHSIHTGVSQSLIRGFTIKNPYGYKTHHALRVDSTEIDYKFQNLFASHSEIDQIKIKDVFLSIEFNSPLDMKNNWTQILNHLPTFSHRERNLVIHKLILENLKVEIRGLGFGAPQIKEVERIELDEISSKQGFPTAELVKQIFGGAGLGEYLQDLINPTKTIEKLFNPGLFSEGV